MAHTEIYSCIQQAKDREFESMCNLMVALIRQANWRKVQQKPHELHTNLVGN